MLRFYSLLPLLVCCCLNLAQANSARPYLSGFKQETAFRKQAVQIVPAVKFSSYKSFRQWKNEKVQDAANRLSLSRAVLESRKVAQNSIQPAVVKTEAVASRDIQLNQLENQMRLDLMAMDMAKDLTVTDYFVGYVNKIQEKKEFINEIAAKMSTEEVAELMTAYAQSIFGAQMAETPKCATNQDSKEVSK